MRSPACHIGKKRLSAHVAANAVEPLQTGAKVAGRGSVIGLHLACLGLVLGWHGIGAKLWFKRRRDPALQSQIDPEWVLPATMRVDEPQRDHAAGGVDHLCARDIGIGHDLDTPAIDPDIADGIQIGLWIHDASVPDDQIEILREGWQSQRGAKCESDNSDQGKSTVVNGAGRNCRWEKQCVFPVLTHSGTRSKWF